MRDFSSQGGLQQQLLSVCSCIIFGVFLQQRVSVFVFICYSRAQHHFNGHFVSVSLTFFFRKVNCISFHRLRDRTI